MHVRYTDNTDGDFRDPQDSFERTQQTLSGGSRRSVQHFALQRLVSLPVDVHRRVF